MCQWGVFPVDCRINMASCLYYVQVVRKITVCNNFISHNQMYSKQMLFVIWLSSDKGGCHGIYYIWLYTTKGYSCSGIISLTLSERPLFSSACWPAQFVHPNHCMDAHGSLVPCIFIFSAIDRIVTHLCLVELVLNYYKTQGRGITAICVVCLYVGM